MKDPNMHFIDKISDGLRKTAIELEEFQVQLALGKAEASDKFEEVKKKFKRFVHTTRQKLEKDEASKELVSKLEELQVQLALGKAETRDLFNAQKKKILQVADEIESLLKSATVDNSLKLKVKHELQKFRLKLEILRLRFALKKLRTRNSLRTAKADLDAKVDRLRKKLYRKESVAEQKWEHFSDEMGKAYRHFRKAFVR